MMDGTSEKTYEFENKSSKSGHTALPTTRRRLTGDGRHLYEVLGIEKGSNPDMIRKAYLKKSKENHPDKNPGDQNSESRMAEIAKANDILSDRKKKAIYDQYGSKGLRAGELLESFDRVNRVTFFLLNFSGALT